MLQLFFVNSFFLCFVLVSAGHFTDDVAFEGSNLTTNERIIQLEEQVSYLQELVGMQTNGSSPLRPLQNSVLADCQEFFNNGYTENGVYTVSPDGRCPFKVYCDMTNGGWTMIQRRYNGNVDFRRNWTEYVHGFGYLDAEHWLGLEKIHRLTSGGSQIIFNLLSYDFVFDHAHYKSFTVHDVMSGYRMNVDPYDYKGTIPELLSYHDGFKFSTYDRDNDQYSSSCCVEYGGGGGWWYNNCYRLGVLNGEFGKSNLAGMRLWDNGDQYILNSVIKIKPREGMC